MDELEQASHGAKVLALFPSIELDLKEGVVVAFTLRLFDFNGRKFLICGEPGGGHVVGEQVSVSYDMAEFYEVAVLDGEISVLAIGGWGCG